MMNPLVNSGAAETGNNVSSRVDCLSGITPAEAHRSVYTSLLNDYSLNWTQLTGQQQQQLYSVELEEHCDTCDPQWQACVRKAYNCYVDSWLRSTTSAVVADSNVKCPVKFDGHQCWAAQLPALKSFLSCTQAIPADYYKFCREILPEIDLVNLHAYRDCGLDGSWVDNVTDYTACNDYVERCTNMTNMSNMSDVKPWDRTELLDKETKLIVTYLFAGLAITSLVLLSISFFIFSYFKTLYCNRNSIHKNLIAALMLHVISLLVILSPTISGDTTIHTEAWLCKSFMFLSFYAVPASIMWTFVEGLYLSQRLTLAVFKKEAPFKIYYFIGWGIPLILSSIWALVTELVPYTEKNAAGDDIELGPNVCWGEYSKQPFHWIITGPCLAALGVNFIFLIMIIIVLVTKLRANNAVETVQVRKAIKATFILVPLLGISNLLFVANPNDKGFGEKAYIVVNLILKGSQGIFVALIYCFLNSEVQMAVQKMFYRAALRRNPESQSFRFGSIYTADGLLERRKSSTRTGSTTVAVSSSEVLRSFFRPRRSSSRRASRHRSRNVSLCNVHVTPVMSGDVTPTAAIGPTIVNGGGDGGSGDRERHNSSVTFAPGVSVMHDVLSDEENVPLTERPHLSSSMTGMGSVVRSPSNSLLLPQKSALSNGYVRSESLLAGEGQSLMHAARLSSNANSGTMLSSHF